VWDGSLEECDELLYFLGIQKRVYNKLECIDVSYNELYTLAIKPISHLKAETLELFSKWRWSISMGVTDTQRKHFFLQLFWDMKKGWIFLGMGTLRYWHKLTYYQYEKKVNLEYPGASLLHGSSSTEASIIAKRSKTTLFGSFLSYFSWKWPYRVNNIIEQLRSESWVYSETHETTY